MTRSHEYDGIILGTGHNALILQAYAERAGFKTISLDFRDEFGGGLATHEWPAGSGFLHNVHSFFHRGVSRMPWYVDLQLEQLGACYIQPALNVAMLCRDGRCLTWWNDFERTAESVAAFNAEDAETLRRWQRAFRPIVEHYVLPESQSPPLPPSERRRLLAETAEGRLLLETSELSALEFVRREFRDPQVQAGLLFFNGLREVDLRVPGFGHYIPSLLASDAMAEMCVGGSKRLAESLVRAVEQTGGEVKLGAPLESIVVQNGRATGVQLRDGQRLVARRFVASSLNPQQTFLDLIGPDHLPEEWVEKSRKFRYNLLAPLFALNVNLREPPRYAGTFAEGSLDQALMVILGLDHVDQFLDIVRHHEAGTIPPTVMWGSCPTRFDPSQAPVGEHTAFMWEKLPYRLGGDPRNWDREKARHGEEMLAMWSRYAPNLGGAVIESLTRSPLCTERTLPNMASGDLLVGSFAGDQVGYHRPFAGAGHYRGHLQGLYLCGSSCHPGGNITGLPGYNCAQVLLSDLGASTPWAPEPVAQRWARR